ncbi:hypothetical protein SLEP1_g23234 [Rubroshorea leprosula]|uniref:peroxidase n=1 Tax=Rubroshorea leprosula TaxID=152421 RepID=A0AAV5JHT9_9ROSI|nr:hypothetical protein SLEP1_g23234 [Rubroshorea leprosula]
MRKMVRKPKGILVDGKEINKTKKKMSFNNEVVFGDGLRRRKLSKIGHHDEVFLSRGSKIMEFVSCADILALAARDSVSFQYKRNLWKVYSGRRDGIISRASEVLGNIPSPFSNFTVLKQNFAKKGLDVVDLVVLSGGHTIGVGHCNAFSKRLYNFTGKGDQDPSLDPTYAAFLKTQCKSLSDNTTFVAMDPGSALNFDNHYYVTLKQHKGLFQSDAALLTNEDARNIVQEFLISSTFFGQFAESMVKMGDIEVLTGEQGQIRKRCAFVNS